jgi:hypothetical protein
MGSPSRSEKENTLLQGPKYPHLMLIRIDEKKREEKKIPPKTASIGLRDRWFFSNPLL